MASFFLSQNTFEYFWWWLKGSRRNLESLKSLNKECNKAILHRRGAWSCRTKITERFQASDSSSIQPSSWVHVSLCSVWVEFVLWSTKRITDGDAFRPRSQLLGSVGVINSLSAQMQLISDQSPAARSSVTYRVFPLACARIFCLVMLDKKNIKNGSGPKLFKKYFALH